jgi:hypothetical protein
MLQNSEGEFLYNCSTLNISLKRFAEYCSEPEGRKYSIKTLIEFNVWTIFFVLDENGIGGQSNEKLSIELIE